MRLVVPKEKKPPRAPSRLRQVLLVLGGLVLVAGLVFGGLVLRNRSLRKAAYDNASVGHIALLANRLSDARGKLTEVDARFLEGSALVTYVNDLALVHFRLGDWKSQLKLADRVQNDGVNAVRRLAPFMLVDALALARNDQMLVRVVDSILARGNPSPSSQLALLSRATDRAALFGMDSAAKVLAIAYTQVSEQYRDSTPVSIVFALHLLGRNKEAVHIADSVDARTPRGSSRAGAGDPRAGTETFRAIAHLWAGDSSMARAVLKARRADTTPDPRGTRHLQAASLAAQLGLHADAIAILRQVVPDDLTFQGGWPESVLLLPLRNDPAFKALLAPR